MSWSLVEQAEGWAADARSHAEQVAREEEAVLAAKATYPDWGDLDPEPPALDAGRAARECAEAAESVAAMAEVAGSEEGLRQLVECARLLSEATGSTLEALRTLRRTVEAEAETARKREGAS